MEIQKTDKILNLPLLLAVFITALTALIGCGGGGSGGSSTNNNSNGDPAPAAVGGKTFHGHIQFLEGANVSASNITWQIVFTGGSTTGSGDTGNYSYAEHNGGSDSGTYTYTKTGANTGVISLSDGTTLQLTYSSASVGTYMISKSGESGTFTSN